MKTARVISASMWLSVAGLCCVSVSCSDAGSGSSKTVVEQGAQSAPAEAENAKIPDDLAKQLNALGYFNQGRPSDSTRRQYSEAKLAEALAGTDSTFVLYDVAGDQFVRHNPERAAKKYSPCSTFKIPNTLIGLDTGVATGSEMVIPWDAKLHPKQPWWDSANLGWDKDHTLRSAFKHSVVWFYQELAKKIGDQRMAKYVDSFEYGNLDTSGGIDRFWLSGSLEISANEQVAFLAKLVGRKLDLKPATYDMAMTIFLAEQTEEYSLYAKTGMGKEEAGQAIGWYVGFVMRDGDAFIFVFNMTADQGTLFKKRVPLAKRALKALDII